MVIKQNPLTRSHDDYIFLRRCLSVVAQFFMVFGVCSGMGIISLGRNTEPNITVIPIFMTVGKKMWVFQRFGKWLSLYACFSDSGIDAWMINVLSRMVEKVVN